MIPPGCHNAHEAGRRVGKSAHWMYKKGAAGEIPRCKNGHTVYWTDAQITEILRAAEQPAKPRQAPEPPPAEQSKKTAAAKRPTSRKGRTTKTKPANGIPTARRDVSRLYREESTA